jgi:hypothetical protein
MPLLSGYITQEKYIRGRSLAEMESLLGFNMGRLKAGAAVYAFTRIPRADEFELRGYTYLPDGGGAVGKLAKDLDLNRLKEILRTQVWSVCGLDRLVKVVSVIDWGGYPMGLGVPQWELTKPVDAVLVSNLLKYGDVYRG